LRNTKREPGKALVTTFEDSGHISEDDVVTPNVPVVTFTERLLRSILDLTSWQQLELVTELATNKDFSKREFYRYGTCAPKNP